MRPARWLVCATLAACSSVAEEAAGSGVASRDPSHDGGLPATAADAGAETPGETLDAGAAPLDASARGDGGTLEPMDSATLPDASARTDSAAPDGERDAGEAVIDAADAPSFRAAILPILVDQCTACHQEAGIAFSLETYEAARPLAAQIAEQTSQRTMPVCNPGDSRCGLTNTDIALIAAWATGGAPE